MQRVVKESVPEFECEQIESKKSIQRYTYEGAKRFFDLCVAFFALILLSPVLLLVAFFVYLGDPGPVIYGQIRIGKNGKPFKMWKFRSMYKNSEQMIDLLTPEQKRQYYTEFKIDNDPRVTKFGKFLRKTSLDELPQLFNVLSNDMSLIGPRPLVASEIQMYYADTYQELLSVKPGITGYWQAYARNNATYQSGKRQEMELRYVRHASIWLDAKILFKTVITVLKREGAQ